jgi:hypothetical protein
MAGQGVALAPDPEVAAVIRSRNLSYPIAIKADFVALMTRSRQPVLYRGKAYDPGFGASLVPDFFFPVTSEQDLIAKVTELLMARGLLPLRRSP